MTNTPNKPLLFDRPTSPHLSVYRWQITNTLSILHRLTGIALAAGACAMVAWLWTAAYSPLFYGKFVDAAGSIPGKIFLIGWTVAFYFHLANGIRHLFWDIGRGFTLPSVTKSGVLVLVFAVLMTVLTWCYVIGATR